MSSFSTAVLVKLMLMGLVSFALLLSVSSLYIGPRYGKRYGDSSRLVLRSSSPRTIQSRSQARFYAGSRYGGKRSYWETSMPESEIPGTSTDFLQQQEKLQQQLQQRQAGTNSPFDCIYLPNLGKLCLPTRRAENPWYNTNGESDEDSGSPSSNNNSGSGSPSVAASDAS